LINCVVVDESGLNLKGPKESVIIDIAVIDVECDKGFMGSDITGANMRWCLLCKMIQDYAQ